MALFLLPPGQHQCGRGGQIPGGEHLGKRQGLAVRGEQRRPHQTGAGDCGGGEQAGLLLTFDTFTLTDTKTRLA